MITLPRVAIIIVNWNGWADTLDCLRSLESDRHPHKEVIVVDNGSTDQSVLAIRTAYPKVTVIEAGANLGFTGGNNLGIAHALRTDTDYIFLLNNDTTCDPNALTALLTAAENNPRFGLLTPVIHYFNQPEKPWFAGSRLDLGSGLAVHDNRRVPIVSEAPIEIPWASGCAMLLHRDTLHRLNGFDERYFLNWEDLDLSLRLRALGKTIALIPSSRILHKVSRSFRATNGIGNYYHLRNHLLLLQVHAGPLRWRAAGLVIAQRLRENFRDWRQGRGHSLRHVALAIRDHLLGRYGAARR